MEVDVNDFILAAQELIYRNGVNIEYSSVTNSYNPATSKTTNTETTTTIKAFPKKVVVNQFNYPNLIGKTLINFMIVALDVTPKLGDVILHDGSKFSVVDIKVHYAQGDKVFYNVIGSK